MTRWTPEEYQQHLSKQLAAKPSKYHAQKTIVEGMVFDSKKEAKRYHELKLLEKAKQCEVLERQPVFPIRVNGVLVAEYRADFRWLDYKTGLEVIEDVKSPATRLKEVYRLKKKLVEAIYGIRIVET